jgi:arylsulfatase A-like enzyme
VNSHQILEKMAQEQAAGTAATYEAEERPQYSETEFPGHAAWLDGAWKLHRIARPNGNVQYELYDLGADPLEATDLAEKQPARRDKMQAQLAAWQQSVARSLNGKDYPPAAK